MPRIAVILCCCFAVMGCRTGKPVMPHLQVPEIFNRELLKFLNAR